MISPEILKKHNLKAVPFSCIGEGQTFNIDMDFMWSDYQETTRKIMDGRVWFANDSMNVNPLHSDHEIVYVPVWRPTKITL